VLKILGHPIPIVRWPDVYKRWKQGDWDVIKSNYVDWKAVVERYRQGTPDNFWAEFTDKRGRYLSYTAIAAHLTAQCVEENVALTKRPRTQCGNAFSSVFSYCKGSTWFIMKDPAKIAMKYRLLNTK